MPGLGNSPILNDEHMSALLTWIRRAWDNYGDAVDPALIASLRSESAGRTMPWSAEELLDPKARSKPQSPQPAVPLAAYREALESGDAERGRVLFHTNLAVRCNACHVVGKFGGGFIGPDLSDVGGRAPPVSISSSRSSCPTQRSSKATRPW